MLAILLGALVAFLIHERCGLSLGGDFRHLADTDWVKNQEVKRDRPLRVARDGPWPSRG
jgi:hypothetical protein